MSEESGMLICHKGIANPWQCDVMGHMNIRHYMAMFDEASYHLLFQVFGWTGDRDTSSGEGWADVRHVIEYQAEVTTGQVVEIRGCLTKVGTKSIGIRYEMNNLVKEELAASLDCVCVLFDQQARKAIPLSDDQRARALAHLVPGTGE